MEATIKAQLNLERKILQLKVQSLAAAGILGRYPWAAKTAVVFILKRKMF
jgi:hypothetical protein